MHESIGRRGDEIVREELGRSNRRSLMPTCSTAQPVDATPIIAAPLESWEGELVTSAFTAAEADHLILSRLGVDAEIEFETSLASDFTVPTLDGRGLRIAAEVCQKYRDLEIGLADASIVVLARQFRTRCLATFDERHFRLVEPLNGGSFQLLPADR